MTSDYVISEMVTQLYRSIGSKQAETFAQAVLDATEKGIYELHTIDSARFQRAWNLRVKFADKPSISFVDFSSFVVMEDLGIEDVFTGDQHFEQVNMGFRTLPQR